MFTVIAVSIYDLRYLRENGELRILRGENTTPRMHVSNLQYSPARPGVLLINYLGELSNLYMPRNPVYF